MITISKRNEAATDVAESFYKVSNFQRSLKIAYSTIVL